jgi:RNA polymerase primary sigma factor
VGVEEQGWELKQVGRDEWAKVLERLTDGRDYITYDEVLALLPEVEEQVELLDALLDELAAMDVAVLGREEAERPKQNGSTFKRNGLEKIPVDDFFSIYLNEVAQEPLLTHDEEIALAQQIERGRQAKRAIEEAEPTADAYARLQDQIQAGQAARERLGWANTRLVISVAKRYRGNGVSFLDLIQNGNVGLMRAVDRYDHHTGNRFATYATWWIRQAVTRALSNHGRIIRIPVHMNDRIRKMAQTTQRLEKEHGRWPTPEEIAAEMGESPVKIRRMIRWASRPLSLEQPAGKDKDVELGHFIEDDEMARPDEATDDHLLGETLDLLLEGLTAREARILRLRYGLQDGQTRTLKQIGEKFGLSRERIRQIERDALTKLRVVASEHRLRHFLGE